jgi:hypothetical protein
MTEKVRAILILSLILGFVFSLNSSSLSANKIERQVLDMGGAMWQTTSNYKLSSSVGQSIAAGPITVADTILYTGFWNPWVVHMTPVEWEEVEDGAELPKEFGLRQNYPNPFNPATVIEYALPKVSEVKIQIYNILGQKVRDLVDERQEPGYKTIPWDGTDDSGKEVSSGIYFYRMVARTNQESEEFVQRRKMILLK